MTRTLAYKTVAHDIGLPMTYVIATPKIRREREKTRREKEVFLDMFEKFGGNISSACRVLDIKRSSLYSWRESDPDFKKRIELFLVERPYIIEDSLHAQALKGSVPASIHILKHTHPNYKPKKKEKNDVHIYHHRMKSPGSKGESGHDLSEILYAEQVLAEEEERQKRQKKDPEWIAMQKRTDEYHKKLGTPGYKSELDPDEESVT